MGDPAEQDPIDLRPEAKTKGDCDQCIELQFHGQRSIRAVEFALPEYVGNHRHVRKQTGQRDVCVQQADGSGERREIELVHAANAWRCCSELRLGLCLRGHCHLQGFGDFRSLANE
jgi:hypothetical protein